MSVVSSLRQRAGALVVDNLFRGLARAGRVHPKARPERHGVEVIRDVPYLSTGQREHLLDVYMPSTRPKPWPVMLYIHGGGFRILSKDTHWLMALGWAARGYLVLNINYRLAPLYPYPAAVEDVAAAYRFVVESAAGYGGDLGRLVFAGESAGANLVVSLATMLSYRRPEPFAQAAYDLGVLPKAAAPACGIFQVTDSERFSRRRKQPLPSWLVDRLQEVERAYLAGAGDVDRTLADPLLFLEQAPKPDRPLPPMFLPVGTRDPILDDTRRMAAALTRLGGEGEARYYPGGLHAFHAFIFRAEARRCWADMEAFLARHI